MHRLGLPWRRKHEHLHFRELVDAIEPIGFLPIRPGLGAITMRNTRVLQWQPIFVDHLVFVVSAKRDFRGNRDDRNKRPDGQKGDFKGRNDHKPREERAPKFDPDSPFAKLAALRDQLKK